ncbi:DUF2782 domain-containing protein [Vulcaniibacterium gelatinicum]|uniref:DUF2782 domain-containing protein n=1 Tax=Vulcaniibacterium gelatinicum TaxID=2598725 RepID=UPI0011CBCD25|nr:DUF2782 domain-containing protein [Vulcaniibacterium gelatinicum]
MIRILTAALALALAGCATPGGEPAVPADAVATTRTEANGDVITEYRVGGLLRMVKVVPARGPTFWLIDSNGDGRLDSSKGEGNVSPVYYQIYRW